MVGRDQSAFAEGCVNVSDGLPPVATPASVYVMNVVSQSMSPVACAVNTLAEPTPEPV